MPLLFIVAALLLFVFVLPGVLDALVGLPFPVKLLVSAGLLVPLGFAMGMPFPTGLRALASTPNPDFPGQNSVEWAWAMNAGSSVLGSVLAIMIAIQFGLNVTLACGAAAYLLAIVLAATLHRRSGQQSSPRAGASSGRVSNRSTVSGKFRFWVEQPLEHCIEVVAVYVALQLCRYCQPAAP